jgi:K+-transporting ATPase KdpF subunit
MVANEGKEAGPAVAPLRSRSGFQRNGVSSDARSILRRGRLHRSARVLGLHQGLRQALGRTLMDYIIAGIASLGLFIYLVYALLRPEKF